jgi:hypothetical protein
MTVIPQHIAKLMSPEDRKAFGKGAMTAEDALARFEVKSERELQKQIVALLRLKGIEPIVSTFGKRTSNNVGTPDILFAVQATSEGSEWREPIAWECKFAKGALSIEQQRMAVRMSTPPNGWTVKTITSVDEAIAELKELEL